MISRDDQNNRLPLIRTHPLGITFNVFVQPRSSKNMIVGLHGDALKIKLTAAPVDNAANRMCIAFLATCLGVAYSRLEIVSGHRRRTKQVLLQSDRSEISSKELQRLKDLIHKLIP